MSPRNALLLVLALSLALVPTVSAQDPSTLKEGPFEPVILLATKGGVAVRAEPGFLFKQLRKLEKTERVAVNGRKGDWLRVQGGGWVSIADVADASQALPDDGPAATTKLRLTSDGVRLRAGPGTEQEIVGRGASGDLLVGVQRQGDWWQLEGGGWVFVSLVEELGASAPASVAKAPIATSPKPQGRAVRRWSYMDLDGTLFEIFEVDPNARFLAGLRQAMRETGVLEDDWTYLRLVISVQKGQRGVRYSPAHDGNPVEVQAMVGDERKRFGSVYVQGPVDRVPMHLRGFFQEQTVEAGERFEGLLMFRPTLDPSQIDSVRMKIKGRPRTFFESD